MSTFAYLRNLVRDRNIASVTPTSQVAVRRLCQGIEFSRAQVIVEYGPGLGVFSRYLLERMPLGSRLLLFETNDQFVEALRYDLRDERVTIYHQSCESVAEVLRSQGGRLADYIISGIPFSLLSTAVRERIIRNTAEALRDDGRFLTYQFFPPPASLDRYLYRPLQSYFEVVRVQYEFRNVPPLRLYESRKREAKTVRKAVGSEL